MKVLVAEHAGFCFGVKRALELAESAALGGPAVTLGPLIHNPAVVEHLKTVGVVPVNTLAEVPPGCQLIIRSHGVGPEIYREAAARGINLVDATCPFVRRVQELAARAAEEGRQVIVVGEHDHPEVEGIVAWSGGRAVVISRPEEAQNLPLADRVTVVAQTTQKKENYAQIIDILKQRAADLVAHDTICAATGARQAAARELAARVDLMLVVGGRNSANTRQLADVCRQAGTPTYHIETAREIDPAWFAGVRVAGVTAGASTPHWIIEEVRNRMMEIKEQMENIEEAMEIKTLHPGDIVRGVVVQVAPDEVLVDVGAKSEGIIPLRELSCCHIASPQDVVRVGDEIEVMVLKAEDDEGRPLLSKEKADAVRAWDRLEAARETGEPVNGVVREVVKGGLLVDVGVRAFLPASLVDRAYVRDLQEYVGRTIQARVIELDRQRRKVILSRKELAEAEYQERRRERLASLEEGQVVRGVVRRLTSFGAFVDLGGIDGLLHVSEMAWHRISHPSEVVKEGDEIEVKILKVDRENEKVSLGLKQVLPDPWMTAAEKYPEGALVKAKIVRLAPFGAFVQLEPGVEGLIHISHLADRRVEKAEDVVKEGDEVVVKVISVEPAEKRMRLSLKEAKRELEERQLREEAPPVKEEGATATIGEMVGDILKKQ